jgi:UDP-glucose 4-epimerase
MILITGGLGFIGLHTAAQFLAVNESVVLTRHRTSHLPDFLARELGRRVFVETVDLSDPAALQHVIAKHAVKGIVHLAAPPLSVERLHDEFAMNLGGLVAVLEAARATRVKRLTIGSSIAVYQALPRGPFHEDAALPMEARTGVEAFKKSFEVLADYHARKTGLDIVCLRLSSIYGPLYRSLVNVPSRLVHAAVRGLSGPLSHPMAPETFRDAAIDLLYVEDCARAIQQVQLAARLRHRIYNVGAGRAISPAEFAAAVRRVVPQADIVLQEGRGPHYRPDAFQDLERIRADVGFEVRHTPESAVAKYVDWLRAGNEH